MKKKRLNRDKICKALAVLFTALFFLASIGIIVACFEFDTSAASSCNHQWTAGYCPVCDTLCEHLGYLKDGKCTRCGYSCPHKHYSREGLDVFCDFCGVACEHMYGRATFTNDKCDICGWNCIHSYDAPSAPGGCKYCHSTCSHPDYLYGECTVCGTICSHKWNNEKCTVCGQSCSHKWSNGKCTSCGIACVHPEFLGYKCVICNSSCKHPHWANGVCLVCLFDCDHLNGFTTDNPRKCKICNSPCGHPSFTNTVCDACGGYCTHPSYSGGKCTACGSWCGHSFGGDPTCDICGGVCTHEKLTTYEPIDKDDHKYYCQRCKTDLGHYNHEFNTLGACYYCGFGCSSHVWLTNGSCYVCGILCPHDQGYTTDNPRKCKICNAPCGHRWNGDNICDNCGGVCLHSGLLNESGECTVCDFACDHAILNYIPNGDDHIIECAICFSEHVRDSDYHTWDGHTCVYCKYECPHDHYSRDGDGTVYCDLCGGYCDHTSGIATYTGGVCDNCGWPCGHVFNGDNVCDECNGVCNHTGYFNDKGLCTQCNYQCIHSWKDGKCTACGVATTGSGDISLIGLFTAIYDAQANTFFSLLGYDILGVNIATLIISVVALAIIGFILKKVI